MNGARDVEGLRRFPVLSETPFVVSDSIFVNPKYRGARLSPTAETGIPPSSGRCFFKSVSSEDAPYKADNTFSNRLWPFKNSNSRQTAKSGVEIDQCACTFIRSFSVVSARSGWRCSIRR